jgi:hypothetical protein
VFQGFRDVSLPLGVEPNGSAPFQQPLKNRNENLGADTVFLLPLGVEPNGSARRPATQQESKRKLRCRSNRAIAICCRGQQPSASLLIWLGLGSAEFIIYPAVLSDVIKYPSGAFWHAALIQPINQSRLLRLFSTTPLYTSL